MEQRKMKIERIDKRSQDYPKRLLNIPDPPEALYVTGDPSILQGRCAGVVGSRRYTLYGKMTAEMVGRHLALSGIAVVSGLAYGIDAFAHEGVLKEGGKAIAVLGMGHRQFSPEKNRALFHRILDTGVVVSEYDPDTPGSRYTFPRRNRIISGLSENLAVIEAGLRSGALITAHFALEQGKEVFAVPGNINSQFSAGTNGLIRDGARPLIVIDDLIRDMGIEPEAGERKTRDLGPDEAKVFGAIERNEGLTINELADALGMKTGPLNAILTVLEIKGHIGMAAGRLYIL